MKAGIGLRFNSAGAKAQLLRIDVCHYHTKVPEKGVSKFLSNTLRFDIDAGSAMRNRACCGKNEGFCSICFRQAVIQGERLENLLRDVYGYTKVVRFFSGNRGIHLWILGTENKHSQEEVDDLYNQVYHKHLIDIDLNLRKLNHPLKCPFSAHPNESLRICLPYTWEEMKDPAFLEKAFTVHTINQHVIDRKIEFIQLNLVQGL
jgi:hypothetical protein